jgi:pimeloyl-ACP methyl ester carboxylesterase
MRRNGITHSLLAATLLTTCLLAGQAVAQTLPRAGSFGVSGATTGTGGAVVERVGPGSTAERMGLKAGDKIVSFKGTAVQNMSDVVKGMANVRANDVLEVEVERSGKRERLRGAAQPRPTETFAGANVSYGAVAHNGGLLRDILVMPANKPDAPVLYLIQGYTCYSIETSAPGGNLYKELIAGLLARGIGFYRVEKAGMGDSRGGTPCAEGGFVAELEGFKAAYKHLQDHHKIGADRIFLLGHSMGGVQAPLVAAASGNAQPRGVAVFGTALRSWHDYMLQVVGVQAFYAHGEDPAALEAALEMGRPALRAIFLEGKSVEEAASISPESRAFLTSMMNWSGGPDLLMRRHSYWSEVTSQKLAAAWRDTKGQVLAMYGEADFAAIDPTDHKRIADIANHYRPGSGRFEMVPRTGHGMQIEGTMAEARDASKAGTPSAPKPYNPVVTQILAEWVDTGLAKPAPMQTGN